MRLAVDFSFISFKINNRCDGRDQRRVRRLLFVTSRCTDDVAAVGLYRGGLWTGVVKVPGPSTQKNTSSICPQELLYYMTT